LAVRREHAEVERLRSDVFRQKSLIEMAARTLEFVEEKRDAMDAEIMLLRRFRDAAVPVCKWVDSDRPSLDYSTHKMRARHALAILEEGHADH